MQDIDIVDTVIVEDETPSLERLKDQLGNFPQIRIVGEALDGEGAVATIDRLRPELVFLDIELPEFNGFEVLNRISCSPMVVFVTAFNEYALKAFEENICPPWGATRKQNPLPKQAA